MRATAWKKLLAGASVSDFQMRGNGGIKRRTVNLRSGLSWCHCVGFSGSGVCLLNSSASMIGILGSKIFRCAYSLFDVCNMCVVVAVLFCLARSVVLGSRVSSDVFGPTSPVIGYPFPNSYPSLVPTTRECVERSPCLGMCFLGLFFVIYRVG